MDGRVSRTRTEHEEGASAVEYGLLVVAIAAAITLVVFLLGTVVSNQFTGTCDSIHQQMTSGNC